jgi:hypothetical protein
MMGHASPCTVHPEHNVLRADEQHCADQRSRQPEHDEYDELEPPLVRVKVGVWRWRNL